MRTGPTTRMQGDASSEQWTADASQHAVAAGGQQAGGAHSLDDDFNHDDTQQQQGSNEMQSFGDDDDDGGGHASEQQQAPRALVEGAAGASTQLHEAVLQQGLDLSLMGEGQEQAEAADSDDGFSEEFPDAVQRLQDEAAATGAGAAGSGDAFLADGLADELAPAEEQDGDGEADFELATDGAEKHDGTTDSEQGGDGVSDEFFDAGVDDGGALPTAAAHAATEENDEVGWWAAHARVLAGRGPCSQWQRSAGAGSSSSLLGRPRLGLPDDQPASSLARAGLLTHVPPGLAPSPAELGRRRGG